MEKVFYFFYKIILKIRDYLKRHNRVDIFSSRHTYISTSERRVVAQLFYDPQSSTFSWLQKYELLRSVIPRMGYRTIQKTAKTN